MEEIMSRILKESRRWLPGVLISLIFIIVLARSVDWQSAGKAIHALDYRYLVPFTLLYFASTGSRAMANRTLLNGKPTFRQSFGALMQGYLLNNILPLRLGELGRAFLLGRKADLATFHALSSIVIERAYDLAFAAMLLIGTLPFVLGDEVSWARPAALTTLGLVVVGLLSLHLIARFRLPLRGWVDRLAGRIPVLERHVLPRIDSFLDGLSALTSLPRFALSSFWMLSTWFFGAANYYVLLLGFVKSTPLWASIFSMGAVSLGIALPSAPASLGVFEGTMVAALAVIPTGVNTVGMIGIDSGTALAYAVLLHFLHIIFSGVIGMLAFTRDGESLMSVYAHLMPKAKGTTPLDHPD
jgi:hypothetical protein